MTIRHHRPQARAVYRTAPGESGAGPVLAAARRQCAVCPGREDRDTPHTSGFLAAEAWRDGSAGRAGACGRYEISNRGSRGMYLARHAACWELSPLTTQPASTMVARPPIRSPATRRLANHALGSPWAFAIANLSS